VLLGIVFLVVISYLARFFDLRTLSSLLQNFISIIAFAMIVLFQSQIRSALATFGKNPLLGFTAQQQVESTFHEIVLAASSLAARRIGVLIVIERLEGLRDYIQNGIALDAVVSIDLLMTIFDPHTPLHDGAAIVQQDRIAAAACFLPLSSNPEISNRYGTRHRAALGISEETDAMAVVVSEETGIISVAFRGRMVEDLDSRGLRNTLHHFMVSELEPGEGGTP
jgi:diadenylate cyclase